MFVLTFGKNGLRRLGAVAVCGVALAGAVFAVGSFFMEGDAAPAAANGSAALHAYSSDCTAAPNTVPNRAYSRMAADTISHARLRPITSFPTASRISETAVGYILRNPS